MPGRAAAAPKLVKREGIQLHVGELPTGPVQIIDGRPARFTEAEVVQSELEHAQRAGAQVERVRSKVAESFRAVRADLNATAGGQASARVMVLAHHAQLAHQALVLQSLAAEKAFGEEAKLQDNALRNTAGLAVVATDALNKAYEAAREEGKRANPVADLRRTIGLSPSDPGADDPDTSAMGQGRPSANSLDGAEDLAGGLSPLSPPGEGVLGPPSPEFPAPPEEPSNG